MSDEIYLDDSPMISDVCGDCAHWHADADGNKCDAFESIPPEIWNGEHDHTTPYPGDHGIMYEAIKVAKPRKVIPMKRGSKT